MQFAAETLGRHVRHSLRAFARTPGFTAAVVLTLALGIGANSAVFSALDAIVLRPLPYPDAGQLVRIRQLQERSAESNIAPVRLEEWNRMNATFNGITGYFVEDVADTSGDLPEMVRRAFVSPRFVDVWGIPPAMGRGFTTAEHQPGGPTAVIVSDRYWRQRLGGNRNVLGSSIRLAGASVPVVGVMPASFVFPDRKVDLWVPVSISEKLAQTRNATWYFGIGRLKSGVTIEQAYQNLSAVQAELGRQYPATDATIGMSLQPLKAMAIGDVGSSLWLLFGAVTVLLLITCTNVAALLLSRSTERRQEIAVRLALGATRMSIVGQMVTETALLAVAGAALGLLAATGTSSAFAFAAGQIPRIDEIALDWRIVVYTLAIAMTATLLCGVLPAVRASREHAGNAVPRASRTQVSGRNSLQWALVGAQVAMSVTLLASAGLLVRSFQELSRVDPGFEPANVLTFRVSGSWAETADLPRLRQRIDETIAHLGAAPGVAGVATSVFLPGIPGQYQSTFRLVEGTDDAATRLTAENRFVSPEYFATMQIPVVGGTGCTRQAFGTPAELMVNRSFVARYLSSGPTPIGLHLSTDTNNATAGRITGVVADARERGVDRAPEPIVYACQSAPNPMPFFLVRTAGDPAALSTSLRQSMKAFAPLRAMYDVLPLDERLGGAFAENRLRTVLLALFAGTALLLATVGLYGTLSYAVNVRRREIGLRLALGAGRATIVRQFLRQGVIVATVAAGCGLLAALAVTRVLSNMLYGVSPTDPLTLASVMAIVIGVAATAALVPAARAAWIEPSRALKE